MTQPTAQTAPEPAAPCAPPATRAARSGTAALTLAALGVAYGDIGTSPLYTVKEVFAPRTGIPLDTLHIVGAVSTIFWALMLVVTLKYVILVLRADNHGEGGILALTALAARSVASRPRLRAGLLLLGVFGATMFYGDSIITPAISVLGAMEGLEVIAPELERYVVPVALAILVLLFSFQRFGTGIVGKAFGPVIVLWFLTLGVSGVVQIVQYPEILQALNPVHAWEFLGDRGWHILAAVGAIVLALTGAEALYADLGHFGPRPIQWAWMGLVMPSLALNYMGQGALLMSQPGAIDNPFFRLFPGAWTIPAVGLATMAAIIASQAVISGAYSMTKQAIQLGFLPRMAVLYTSSREVGQIYMPGVNRLLLIGVAAVVIFFGSSSALAGAYGIAVTVTMLMTTLLTFFVVRNGWRLPLVVAVGATSFFLALDLLMVAGCAIKLFDGGWFPLAAGSGLFVLMSTWSRGRALILGNLPLRGVPLQTYIRDLAVERFRRVGRTAVYLVATGNTVPAALINNLKHNQILHERNIVLHIAFHEVPWIGMTERAVVESLGHAFWRVTLNYGFMNVPDVPKALRLCERDGLTVPQDDITYFLSRTTAVPTPGEGMAMWRERLFAAMSKRSGSAAEYFHLPDDAVVQLGTRVAI